MQTKSELSVTKISTNVFYREFTFHKNDFITPDGQKELADNIMWIDDLLFVIQVKERNPKDVKTQKQENKWFENTVLKKAKNQVKDTIRFFNTYGEIKIQNGRGHVIDISKAKTESINNIIIYQPNSTLLNGSSKSIKFCHSSEVGYIHLLNIEDYLAVCQILLTPPELDEYLKFRERIYRRHPEIINYYPEHYILAHFLNTDDETFINPEYLLKFQKLQLETVDFDLGFMLQSFADKLTIKDDRDSKLYYAIVKEISKLNRNELAAFKERYLKVIKHVQENSFSMPYRCTFVRTGCGFVFIPLTADDSPFWENILLNCIDIYKYKHRLSKCLGLSVYKDGEEYCLNWGFIEQDWTEDQEMENELQREENIYGKGEQKIFDRYKFNDL